MKSRILVTVIVLCVVAPGMSSANELGLGFKIGEPTGVGAKIWKSPGNSVNLALAYSTGANDQVTLLGDYVFYKYNLFNPEHENIEIPLYYGIGVMVRMGEKGDVGARIPVGVDFLFADPAFDISFEVAPTLYVIPETDFGVYGGLGIYYTF